MDEYIILKVPTQYNCVYKNLLTKMSELGVDLLKSCDTMCKHSNNNLIVCWNMFQSACAAYELGEINKATIIVNYIITQLRLPCEIIKLNRINIYNFNLNVTDITGEQDITLSQIGFSIDNINLVKPNTLALIYINNNNEVLVDNLEVRSPQYIDKTIHVYPNTTYSWMLRVEDNLGNYYFSNAYSIRCKSTGFVDETIYYNCVNEDPKTFKNKTAEELFAYDNKTILFPGNLNELNTKMNQTDYISYLLVPKKVKLNNAQYGSGTVTILINPDRSRQLYVEVNDLEYNGNTYTMYYYYSPIGEFATDILLQFIHNEA